MKKIAKRAKEPVPLQTSSLFSRFFPKSGFWVFLKHYINGNWAWDLQKKPTNLLITLLIILLLGGLAGGLLSTGLIDFNPLFLTAGPLAYLLTRKPYAAFCTHLLVWGIPKIFRGVLEPLNEPYFFSSTRLEILSGLGGFHFLREMLPDHFAHLLLAGFFGAGLLLCIIKLAEKRYPAKAPSITILMLAIVCMQIPMDLYTYFILDRSWLRWTLWAYIFIGAVFAALLAFMVGRFTQRIVPPLFSFVPYADGTKDGEPEKSGAA